MTGNSAPAARWQPVARATGGDPSLTAHVDLLPAAALQGSTPAAAPVEPGSVGVHVPSGATAAAAGWRRLGRWWTAQPRRTPPAAGAAAPPPVGPQPGRPVKGAVRQVTKVRTSLLVPRPDVFPPPTTLRGTHLESIGNPFLADGWFLLAAHGGAGAGLLARLSAGQQDGGGVGLDAGHLWPEPALETSGAVVVVSRTTVSGLTKARDLGAQYLSGAAPSGTALLGVVLVADQPGKLPPPVAASVALLDGVFARTWHVPYVPQYRLVGPTSTPPVHPLIADVLTDIRAALGCSSAFPTTEGPSQ